MPEKGKATARKHSFFDDDGMPYEAPEVASSRSRAKSPRKSPKKSPNKGTTRKRAASKSPKKSPRKKPVHKKFDDNGNEIKKKAGKPKASVEKGNLPKRGTLKRLFKTFMPAEMRLGETGLVAVGDYARRLVKLVTESAISYTKAGRRVVVQLEDVTRALEANGLEVHTHSYSMAEIKRCGTVETHQRAKQQKTKVVKASNAIGYVKNTKVDLAKALKFDFTDLSCVTMQKLAFARMVREYSDHGIKWSADGLTVFQINVERLLLEYAASAAVVAAAGGRATVRLDDAAAAKKLTGRIAATA